MSKKSHSLTLVLTLFYLLLIPLTLWLGFFYLGERRHVLISTVLVILTIVPFFVAFEGKRAGTKEIVLLAVLTALTAGSRVAFFMLQNFKPLTAMIIISGIALGARSGFLVGALATLISNFYYGQGPWTPWQMLGFGLLGFLAGLLFRKKLPKNIWVISLFGALATYVVYGGISNLSMIIMYSGIFTVENILTTFSLAVPFDLMHALSSAVFLLILSKPMLLNIERIKTKYGIVL